MNLINTYILNNVENQNTIALIIVALLFVLPFIYNAIKVQVQKNREDNIFVNIFNRRKITL